MDFLQRWHDHFTANAEAGRGISAKQQPELTDQEKNCIEKSIAAFQLGEYSEGKGLLRAAESFAQKTGDEHLVGITKMFILEEQNHANLLRRFMLAHNIKLLKRHWVDVVFRQMRKTAGFELSITVLITAEIIALVYYEALKASTGSTQLKNICNKILADEFNHVRYESELINHIRYSKPRILRYAAGLLHLILFCGTIMVVYFGHRRVLNRGGYQFDNFWKACWMEFAKCFYPKALSHVSLES